MAFLLYGAYGYTGRLIAHEAKQRGLTPILAGRDPTELNAMGERLDLPVRVVSLSETARLQSALRDVPIVLHCAGPFVHTAPPMVTACLRTGTHYLDLTGEIRVFRGTASRDEEARSAGIMLLPGIGFDVVPSDCLARAAAAQVSGATSLEIAIFAEGTVSQGTLKTLIEQMGQGGYVRRDGQLRRVPPGWTSRTVNFGDQTRRVISIPEGSVVTTGYSTDVPNVTAYLALPKWIRRLLRASRYFQGLLSSRRLKQFLKRLVEFQSEGPSPERRMQGRTVVWVSARRGAEKEISTRIHGPEAYTFTVHAALAGVERVLNGTAPPGYHTPATAFGSDFVTQIPGVERGQGEGVDLS